MKISTPYIPREYLALKINYCKKGLAKLPEVSLSTRKIHGEKVTACIFESHVYKSDSKNGAELFQTAKKRMSLISELTKLEGIWYSQFNCPVPEDYQPHKVVRQINTGYNGLVNINKQYFDSLKNDANPNHRDKKFHVFNGICYRSNIERNIAAYYTEQGIPFKYEPEVWIAGLNKPIYPDFVAFYRELDLCKFHEHFGLMDKTSYLREAEIKYNDYSNAGLVPGLDILFTYDISGMPFDIRSLGPAINLSIYNSMLLPYE